MRDSESAEIEDRGAANAELGETLRAAREAQDLSIEQIAAELRIEARLLHALEEQRFNELGAPVFAKGYLKQYANCLDLDYGDLLHQYYQLAEPREVAIEPSKVIQLRDERQITIWVVAALTLLLIGVFLFIWMSDQSQRSAPPPVSPAATDLPVAGESVSEALAAEAAPTPTPRSTSTPTLAPAPDPAPVPQEVVQSQVEPRIEAEVVAADAEPPSATQEPATGISDLGAEPSLVAATETAELALAEDGTVSIVLDFAADSWTEISDARGERLYYDLGRAATRVDLRGVPPLSFLLGDADAVSVSIDGEPYTPPAGSRRGNTAIFTLDPSE